VSDSAKAINSRDFVPKLFGYFKRYAEESGPICGVAESREYTAKFWHYNA